MRGKTTQEKKAKKKKKSPAENDLKGQGEAYKTTFKHSLFLRPGPGTTYLPGINDLFNRSSSSKKRKKGGKKDAWGNDRSQRTIGRDAVPSIRLRLLSWQPTAGGKEWGGGGVRQPLINSQVMNALPGMVTVALSLRSLSRVRGAQCGRRGLWHGRARDPAGPSGRTA